MKKWVTTAELLERGGNFKTEVDLADAIKNEGLEAYDTDTDEPVDWAKEKKEFNELGILLEKGVSVNIRNKILSAGIPREPFDPLPTPPLPQFQKQILHISPAEDAPNIPWRAMKQNLQHLGGKISFKQYYEIKNGWRNIQIINRLATAKFLEKDVAAKIEDENTRKAPGKDTLDKFIGALIVIFFLDDKFDWEKHKIKKHTLSDSSPDYTAITNSFLFYLSSAGFESKGLVSKKDSNFIQNIFSAAIEQISKNKIALKTEDENTRKATGRETLLKFIGALIEIFFLDDKFDIAKHKKKKYTFNNGSLNYTAIKDSFLFYLSSAGFENKGVGSETSNNFSKNILPPAIELILENKIKKDTDKKVK